MSEAQTHRQKRQHERERYARIYQAICGERGDLVRHEQTCAVLRLLEGGSYL